MIKKILLVLVTSVCIAQSIKWNIEDTQMRENRYDNETIAREYACEYVGGDMIRANQIQIVIDEDVSDDEIVRFTMHYNGLEREVTLDKKLYSEDHDTNDIY